MTKLSKAQREWLGTVERRPSRTSAGGRARHKWERNMGTLIQAGLVVKQSDGTCTLTPAGRAEVSKDE